MKITAHTDEITFGPKPAESKVSNSSAPLSGYPAL
jgi:hypothetical protein